jgi:putative membrane-bound dehydrogenase-like protein
MLPRQDGLGERFVMKSARQGLWIAISSAMLGAASASAASPPRALDSRLVFERIAAEPEIVTPTGIAVDHRGRVLIVESHTHFRPAGYQGPPADRIRVFEDQDHDGKPECTGTFFEGTQKTMNVAVARDGSVFVATRSALYRLEDRDGDGRSDGTAGGKLPTPIIRLDTRGDYPHNGLSGFAFDDAGRAYFGLGENLGADYRLIGPDGTTLSGGGEGGNIYRCQPDGTQLERVATGFWNPFHVAFDVFGRLFAVDNDPDSRPPCRLLHIVDGGDYGYRFRNGRKGLHPFTAWNGELPGTLGMVAGTGEAPSGVIAYESDNLPEDYRGTLLVTSWGDHRIEQYRLEPHGATFRSVMKPVVAGGDDFRPVGIAAAPDGSLYISDWVDKSYSVHGKGRIWRLRNAHAIASPARAAGPGGDRVSRLSAIALQSLAASGSPKDEAIAPFVKNDSADVRALAARILPSDRFDLKAIAASDPSPLVRAEAMRRLADPAAKDVLLKALESDDSFVQQAARRGLGRSLKVDELIVLAATKDLTARQRLGLLLILRDSGRPEARALLPGFLADSDPLIHFAAIQWVGEYRLEPFRAQLLTGLASSAATRNLFEATLAALEQLDGKIRDPRNEMAGEDYIVALLRDSRTAASVLERGLRMLRPSHPALTLDRLRRFATGNVEGVAIEAVRTLGQSSTSGRFAVLSKLAVDRNASLPLRAEAIAGLADDATSQRAALLALATGEQAELRREALRDLRGIPLTEQEKSALRASSRGDAASLELVDSLAATGDAGVSSRGPERPAATDLDAWLGLLEGPADPMAGERVFFHSKGPGCCSCHQVNGRGARAGPDLSTLAVGMDRRRLVESILTPSKEIAPQFVAWSVARTDGTVFTGILLEQSPEGSLIFADAQGRLTAVKAGEIAERKPQTISIMPDHLTQTMTLQDFRDLLAFLWRRK